MFILDISLRAIGKFFSQCLTSKKPATSISSKPEEQDPVSKLFSDKGLTDTPAILAAIKEGRFSYLELSKIYDHAKQGHKVNGYILIEVNLRLLEHLDNMLTASGNRTLPTQEEAPATIPFQRPTWIDDRTNDR